MGSEAGAAGARRAAASIARLIRDQVFNVEEPFEMKARELVVDPTALIARRVAVEQPPA